MEHSKPENPSKTAHRGQICPRPVHPLFIPYSKGKSATKCFNTRATIQKLYEAMYQKPYMFEEGIYAKIDNTPTIGIGNLKN